MIWAILGAGLLNCVFFCGVLLVMFKWHNEIKNMPPPTIEIPPIHVDTTVDTTEIRRDLQKMKEGIPEYVVRSLTGVASAQKGRLGELTGYLALRAEYDRIIPLGSIADFIAIKLPTDTDPGYIHFVDVKTGKSARLTSDQRKFRELIEAKQLGFKTIKIDTLDGIEC